MVVSRREFLMAGMGWILGMPDLHQQKTDQKGLPQSRPMVYREDYDCHIQGGPSGLSIPEDHPLVFSGMNQLFLTFDDGPLEATKGILNTLALKSQKATFFIVGKRFLNKAYRNLAVRAAEEGHELANHSYSHPLFSTISGVRAKEEIESTHRLIEEVLKEARISSVRQNRFFRFPYGDPGSAHNNRTVHSTLKSLGYVVSWWDLDTYDWRMQDPQRPYKSTRIINAVKRAAPTDVVLLHDTMPTAQLLPGILEILRAKELESVTLSRYNRFRVGQVAKWTAKKRNSPGTVLSQEQKAYTYSESPSSKKTWLDEIEERGRILQSFMDSSFDL